MKRIPAIALGLILFLIITGLSWAGQFDYNPDQIPIQYKNDVTSEKYYADWAKKLLADM